MNVGVGGGAAAVIAGAGAVASVLAACRVTLATDEFCVDGAERRASSHCTSPTAKNPTVRNTKAEPGRRITPAMLKNLQQNRKVLRLPLCATPRQVWPLAGSLRGG